MKKRELHPTLKEILGYKPNESGKAILTTCKRSAAFICKPCWELKYCPFGPLVEQFPLFPPTRQEAEKHNNYLTECLKSGRLADGRPLSVKKRKSFQNMVRSFNPSAYPEEIPEPLDMMCCRIFGHVCPVFFTAEPETETKQIRRHGRYIPREIMLKVVRRDGQMCQVCHNYVPDDQLDFDHVIPHTKGGPVTADNLRVVHSKCNREKSDTLDTILAPNLLSKQLLQKKQKGDNPRKKRSTRMVSTRRDRHRKLEH